MESKYYTPKLEEFHIGFEYETNYLKKDWTKVIMQSEDSGYFFDNYIADASPLEFRVKHLDREDIESLGWEFIKNHPGTTSYDFYNEKYSLSFDPDFGPKWNLRIYDGEDQDNEFNYFNGMIKNKSELKKLMVQLGIINEKIIEFYTPNGKAYLDMEEYQKQLEWNKNNLGK